MTPMDRIDLNCDMGESDDESQVAIDLALLESVTSINIACGGHAGNDASMERTVWAAMSNKVAVGAHPSYPDCTNFGRMAMDMPVAELERTVRWQVASLASVCAWTGTKLTHVKPHGALYHAAATRTDIAEAIASAAQDVDPLLVLVGFAGSPGLAHWKSLGCRVASEAFADRRYEKDGSLRNRQHADAVITNPKIAAGQALHIAVPRSVSTVGGGEISLHADTLCVHSDTPGAPEVAKVVRYRLEQVGVRIAAMH